MALSARLFLMVAKFFSLAPSDKLSKLLLMKQNAAVCPMLTNVGWVAHSQTGLQFRNVLQN